MKASVLLLAWTLIALPGSCAWSDPRDFGQIDRGPYLATVGDCLARHTAADGKSFAGGRAIATPFGTLVSPNIAPDRETGIGAWTDDEFVRAMRKGAGRGGRHLYPAFPYPYFTLVTRDDLLRLRGYLATIDPVRNTVDVNRLPFPFNIRAVMAIWNGLFFRAKEFRTDPAQSEEWNRGAYLVTGLGHCGACHTAKNIFGADQKSGTFAGGKLQGWFSPNLTNDHHVGLGAWTVDEVVDYLHSGHNKNAAASGPMAEVVSLSTSHMTLPDLRAMAVYLKGGSGADEKPPSPPANETVASPGQAIFEAQCEACHQSSGRGVTRLFPGLAGAPSVQADDASNLLRVVLQGGKSVATRTNPTGAAMPAFGWKLSDEQIAAVASYVRNGWGNRASAVSPGEVATARRELARE
jgi:mono/diheme cytochrome c family protein